MGRVGRYGQDCSRYKHLQLETLVSDKASRALRFKILGTYKRVQKAEPEKK